MVLVKFDVDSVILSHGPMIIHLISNLVQIMWQDLMDPCSIRGKESRSLMYFFLFSGKISFNLSHAKFRNCINLVSSLAKIVLVVIGLRVLLERSCSNPLTWI